MAWSGFNTLTIVLPVFYSTNVVLNVPSTTKNNSVALGCTCGRLTPHGSIWNITIATPAPANDGNDSTLSDRPVPANPFVVGLELAKSNTKSVLLLWFYFYNI